MVSIITINFNGWRDTSDLLTSLKQYETYPYEVIVVDNASTGDDVVQLELVHPDVKIVRSELNLGFAGGNNLGYQYAKGDYIFFLNNDMVVKTPVLGALVSRLVDRAYAGVSPCIAFLYNTERIQYYGYKDMTSITLKHTTEPYNPLCSDYFLQPKETEVLHGGAMLIRRDVVDRVGKMTEIYFLFYEEFDWSRRMREAGYKLFYEPASVVYHKEGMTIKPQTPLREYYLSRARMIYARRNCQGIERILACTYQLLLAMPKKVFIYILKGEISLANSVFRGAFSGLFLLLK